MRNLKPVYVMCQEGVATHQLDAVIRGINSLVALAMVGPHIEVINFGVWRHKSWHDEQGKLIPFHSSDWYVQRGKEDSKRQGKLNAYTMLTALYIEKWQELKPHYDVFVVRQDMYSGEENNNFVIGLAYPGRCTVVSTYRFRELEATLQAQCVETEVMHELGHVFGLIPDDRIENVTESLGRHCTNRCVMRQGLRLPDDWVRFTKERLQHGALCNRCQEDLQQYFR